MIRHCVLFRFRHDIPPEEIDVMMNGFAALVGVIPGLIEARIGVNVSPEGLDQGFRHGFTMDFEDAASRDDYLTHPEHLTLATQVIAALDNGTEGVIVLDLDLP